MLRLYLISVLMLSQSGTQSHASLLPQANHSAQGEIHGRVERGDGSFLPNALVRLFSNNGLRDQTTADVQGRYTFHGVAPGKYRIVARGVLPSPSVSRTVTVSAGVSPTRIDLRLPAPAAISGRVVDEKGEPMPDVSVRLIVREYRSGVLSYSYAGFARTNDLGRYKFESVAPNRSHLLHAKIAAETIPAISNYPQDRALRRPVPAPIYYVNSPSVAGAIGLILRDGEDRNDVELRMTRSPNFCAEGVLKAEGEPAVLQFRISPKELEYGVASFMGQAHGVTEADGKVRICDLSPGEYRITAYRPSAELGTSAFFGTGTFTIVNDDISGISPEIGARVPVTGQIIWEGAEAERPADLRVFVELRPLNGAYIRDLDEPLNVRSEVPGNLLFPVVRADSYEVVISGLPEAFCISDISDGGRTILQKPLVVGGGLGAPDLLVKIGRSCGALSTEVADTAGKRISDATVCIMPAQVATIDELAGAMICAQTDQYGRYEFAALRPGTYSVVATASPIGKTPEGVSQIWTLRAHGERVELMPGTGKSIRLRALTTEVTTR
jgi:protocatechuate 3,4-dioxygenase beta subunit